jgi:hypothetical protein
MSCSVDHSTIKHGGFCTGCGLRIEHIEPPVQQSATSVNYCPNGHAVPAQKKFCETCGTMMTGLDGQSNLGYSSGSAPSSGGYPSPGGGSAHVPPPPPPQPGSGAGFAAQSQPYAFSANPTNSMMPPQRNNIPLFVGLGIAGFLILILIITAVSNGSSGGGSGDDGGSYTPSTTTVSVTMSVNGQYCNDLSWGYSDIPGGSIILSIDGLSAGYASYSSYGTDTSSSCDFNAYFYGVPTGGSIYSIRMASGLRGSVDNYQWELESNGWQFNLSLG